MYMIRKEEIKTLEWGYETFQKCVPSEYRTEVSVLLSRYYSTHPEPSFIQKILDLEKTWNPEQDKRGLIEYIKDELK